MTTITPKKKLLMEAKGEANLVVANKRLELANALIELDDIEAEDDYELSITTLLQAFGTPQSLTFLSRILPDGTALADARKSLREPNAKKNRPVITEEYKDPQDKTRLMIKLRSAPTEQQGPAASAPIAGEQSPAVSAPVPVSLPAAPVKAEEVVTAPAVMAPPTAA